MAAWRGWGRGPAGAGAAPPSRAFLALGAVGAVAVAAVLASEGRWGSAAAIFAAGAYFALRFAGRLGPGREP